ncbi:hypothetical protein [Aureitalea marina]|uniref:Uncharacterized protein n=1 Tax=Aureitalea marina TaxID=930804 RepID=A0A2S7KNT4_9FLAO|nr:hypothetical protein [Aureitalea marina]PQB04281.1 hypothetical protein BST85_04730 [Aureitalea marina]
MSTISEIVENLEIKIHQLVKRQKESEQESSRLKAQLEEMTKDRQELENQVDTWREKCNSLKLANSMLGSDQYKRETKLKINALIREIDHCIGQLSD